ncbi:MAG: MFS transporter [Gammaproteobacteria bacterium]|nr:MFS transporter [Gammaproteobacteria bacterium]MYF37884.1 MFS transporter [Gammaproteobacteria bacterium]
MGLLGGIFGSPKLQPEQKRSLKHEQVTDLTYSVALAMLEGSVIGVIADKIYDVPAFVIAILVSAPFFGSLSSYFWARLANARPKVPVIVILQFLVVACLLLVATAPRNMVGSVLLVTGVVCARTLTAGVITIRSVVWSLNYPRDVRARTTGRLQVVTSLVMVLTTLIAAPILDANPMTFRWMYIVAMLIALLGVRAFARVNVAGERRQRVRERRSVKVARSLKTRFRFFQILRQDKRFARYQVYQFLNGISNMSIEAPLIYLVSRELQASFTVSFAILMILPFFFSTLTIPLWARYLDRVHITHFRTRITGVWVLAQLLIWFGAMFQNFALLGVARSVQGVARSGGSLGWQLGHNDFAPRDKLSDYMSVHVTLTGIRGVIAAVFGIGLYVGWSDIAWLPDFPGLKAQLFLVCLVIGVISWIGFIRMHQDMKREKARSQKE